MGILAEKNITKFNFFDFNQFKLRYDVTTL